MHYAVSLYLVLFIAPATLIVALEDEPVFRVRTNLGSESTSSRKNAFNAYMMKASEIDDPKRTVDVLSYVSEAYKVCPLCGIEENLLENTANGNKIVQTLNDYDNFPERRWLMERILPAYVKHACKHASNLIRVMWIGVDIYTLRYEHIMELLGKLFHCQIDFVQIEYVADKAMSYSSFSTSPILSYDVSDLDAITKEPLLASETFDLIFAFGVIIGKIAGNVPRVLQSYNYLLKSGGLVLVHEENPAYEAAIAKMSASDPPFKFSVHDTYEYTSDTSFQERVLFLKKNASLAPTE
jgi:hypothetical protein